MKKDSIYNYLDNFELVKFSKGYGIQDFNCEIEEYNQWLINEASRLQESHISYTHLLINKMNGDVVSYMTLLNDTIKLKEEEIKKDNINCNFKSFPAVKIGKLAVDKNYKEKYFNIGSLMITLSKGFICDLHKIGIACKYKKRTNSMSMRKDILVA